MRAALVFRQRMNFIDDEPADRFQSGKPSGLAEQNTEALRRREQNMRRRCELLLPRIARGVSRAQPHSDWRGAAVDGLERLVKILLEIIAQSPERRNVDGVNPPFQVSLRFLESEFTQHRKERREGFAGAGRRNDEDILTSFNPGPCGELGWRRRVKGGFKPRRDR